MGGVKFSIRHGTQWLAAAALLVGSVSSLRAATLYSTFFNNPPFSASTRYWAGVDGWLASDPDNGSAAVTSAGGAVYLGLVPPAGSLAGVSKRFNYDPVANKTPILRIRADLALVDSTNNHWDTFGLGIYNSADALIGAVIFDNETLAAYYNDGFGNRLLPIRLVNDAPFQVTLTADFSTNRASLTIQNPGSDALLQFADIPFHNAGNALNFGSFQVLWVVNGSGTAGDNYLVVDALSIEALAAPKLSIDKGLRHRSRGSSYKLRGWQAAEDNVRVEVLTPGKRRWAKINGTAQRWSFPVKDLEVGRNVIQVRLLNVVDQVIDQKKVIIVRK